MPDLRLHRKTRLRRAEDFHSLHLHGTRAGDEFLLVIGRRNDCGFTRFGLSVSRRHGSAVNRNRKRRLLRESFRLEQQELPAGLDLILIPRHRVDLTLQDFRASLRRLVKRLDERLPALPHTSPHQPPGGSDRSSQVTRVPDERP